MVYQIWEGIDYEVGCRIIVHGDGEGEVEYQIGEGRYYEGGCRIVVNGEGEMRWYIR